jgi:hypothetical protein
MLPSVRDGAIMVSLVLCVGLAAAAQTGGVHPEGAGFLLADETGGSLTRFADNLTPISQAGGRRATLPLSDEQRSRIYESVMKIANAPVSVAPAPEVAEALPRGVPLQDLPAALIAEVAAVQGHRFVKLDDRILVVDPASRTVVAMIPRGELLP